MTGRRVVVRSRAALSARAGAAPRVLGPLMTAVSLVTVGCGPIIRERKNGSIIEQSARSSAQPQICSREEAAYILEESGKNVVYGDGLGKAALNIGAIVAFPPFAVYRLGQAVASMAGYDVDATGMLPEGAQRTLNETYDAVGSVPGRTVAKLADEEYRYAGHEIQVPEAVRERCGPPVVKSLRQRGSDGDIASH